MVTNSGDINIESDCYAEECHLISQQGNVRFGTVYGSAVNVKITEIGNASVCIVKGSLNMNIAIGHAKLFISSLTEDSVANISDGDVYLNVPKHMEELFKLKVTAPSVKIDSNLKHTKSDLKNTEGGSSLHVETLSESKNENMPILEVNVKKGTVKISAFLQTDQSYETNYKSYIGIIPEN